jgi:OTU domain-containing protein 5
LQRERRFEKKMRKKGYIIKKMGEDGACLFRAVSDQVYGDQEMHNVVRKHCMDYIVRVLIWSFVGDMKKWMFSLL